MKTLFQSELIQHAIYEDEDGDRYYYRGGDEYGITIEIYETGDRVRVPGSRFKLRLVG